VQINFIDDAEIRSARPDELPALLAGSRGVVRADLDTVDDRAKALLTDVFAVHPLALRDLIERNQVPKVHVYPGQVSWCCTLRRAEPAVTCTSSRWTSSSETAM